ncbi:hypothetical protein HYPSUDRAFT_629082 [Hypholoma sublateritium FD-334 SS-4]|uniref:Uncharacterized protein n=1 Tax=Hypholoma sublateritium (strain FD-334 SS-4) TaxID=945553 RepID=A0A0D2PDK6_HYPSF|nr:hypothetical protein HYPSUDRAFT_629082 [Hypholoma sublateritium FD-334 SS-4]
MPISTIDPVAFGRPLVPRGGGCRVSTAPARVVGVPGRLSLAFCFLGVSVLFCSGSGSSRRAFLLLRACLYPNPGPWCGPTFTNCTRAQRPSFLAHFRFVLPLFLVCCNTPLCLMFVKIPPPHRRIQTSSYTTHNSAPSVCLYRTLLPSHSCSETGHPSPLFFSCRSKLPLDDTRPRTHSRCQPIPALHSPGLFVFAGGVISASAGRATINNNSNRNSIPFPRLPTHPHRVPRPPRPVPAHACIPARKNSDRSARPREPNSGSALSALLIRPSSRPLASHPSLCHLLRDQNRKQYMLCPM